MDTLAIRLKTCREEACLTQTGLAKLAHLKNQSIIGSLESGHRKSSSYIPVIAQVLGVDSVWLATGKGRKEPQTNALSADDPAKYRGNISEKIPLRGRVPLISLVAAGNWSESVDNFQIGDAEQWIATTVTVKRHTYALRVEGDSMEPKFPHGAIIIVEPEDEPRNGSYVIVRQNDSDATFKQLVIDGGNTYLKPLNDRYPIMQMRADAVICGVVKQMVMDV